MAKGFIRERVTKKGEHRWDVVVNYRILHRGMETTLENHGRQPESRYSEN